MTPAKNPFAPGAGVRPPELAGRDEIIEGASIALKRIRSGFHARGQLLLGLRGVGKTVLLIRIKELAEEAGCHAVVLEAPEDRSLAEMLVPRLRTMFVQLSRLERSKEVAKRGLAVLRAFAAAFKVKVGEVEVGVEKETGTADSGNLEADLPEMLLLVARSAAAVGSAVVLIIDEVQYLSKEDLSALLVSIHRIGQEALPFIFFGAGLPQLAALAGEAKSYAERLFVFPEVGPLPVEAAKSALREPVRQEGAEILDEALDIIADETKGYPYFLQEWGKSAWDVAASSPIVAADARRATAVAQSELDSNFFKVRFDRLTPREKDYLRAMAELGPQPHGSGEIAELLGKTVTAAAPLRDKLIRKGMIYSPQYGDTAFTVPMFDKFMHRSMPDWVPDTHGTDSAAVRKARPKKR